jgi:hypothetical protein
MNTLQLAELKRFLLQEQEQDNPKELYHATYKRLLKPILTNGLDTNKSKKSWEDSIPGYVYLAKDPDVAVSYAETSEAVPEEWIDNIVLITVRTQALDQSKLFADQNVRNDTTDTLEYRGVIPSSAFVSVRDVNTGKELL